MAPKSGPEYQKAYVKRDWNRVDELTHALAKEYALSARPEAVEALGANRFALPSTGEAYMIASIGLQNSQRQIHDYRSGEDRALNWEYHFGAVVADSGDDRVTLENYARGDGKGQGGDPRWYFQMYGKKQGQSFHEFHEARRDHANPVTVVVNNEMNDRPFG